MIIYIFIFVSSFWGKLRNTFYGIIHCRLHLTQKRGWFANFTHFEFWIIKVTNRYFFQQKVTNKLIFFPATNLQINTFSCEKDINWNLFVQIVTFPHKKVTVHNLFDFNFYPAFLNRYKASNDIPSFFCITYCFVIINFALGSF